MSSTSNADSPSPPVVVVDDLSLPSSSSSSSSTSSPQQQQQHYIQNVKVVPELRCEIIGEFNPRLRDLSLKNLDPTIPIRSLKSILLSHRLSLSPVATSALAASSDTKSTVEHKKPGGSTGLLTPLQNAWSLDRRKASSSSPPVSAERRRLHLPTIFPLTENDERISPLHIFNSFGTTELTPEQVSTVVPTSVHVSSDRYAGKTLGDLVPWLLSSKKTIDPSPRLTHDVASLKSSHGDSDYVNDDILDGKSTDLFIPPTATATTSSSVASSTRVPRLSFTAPTDSQPSLDTLSPPNGTIHLLVTIRFSALVSNTSVTSPSSTLSRSISPHPAHGSLDAVDQTNSSTLLGRMRRRSQLMDTGPLAAVESTSARGKNGPSAGPLITPSTSMESVVNSTKSAPASVVATPGESTTRATKVVSFHGSTERIKGKEVVSDEPEEEEESEDSTSLESGDKSKEDPELRRKRRRFLTIAAGISLLVLLLILAIVLGIRASRPSSASSPSSISTPSSTPQSLPPPSINTTWLYIGCYADAGTPSSTLPLSVPPSLQPLIPTPPLLPRLFGSPNTYSLNRGLQLPGSRFTPKTCFDACAFQAAQASSIKTFGYAGVQYFGECWCGETFTEGMETMRVLNETECNVGKCVEDGNAICGTANRMSMFQRQ
ncbi:hypothetical protein BC829DRAFT_434031 [Chytridium lagenaria]|nr:hypothetical protein BC829DRAFT_434031 [Chytridium lagenaria]